MREFQEEFTKYKTIISIWSPKDLDAKESQYSTLKEQLDLVKKTVDESVKELEEVNAARNLFSLQKESGSKIEYPKFSKCFLKFREKMERAFRANRVPKEDQVDKLGERLSGFHSPWFQIVSRTLRLLSKLFMTSGETLREFSIVGLKN